MKLITFNQNRIGATDGKDVFDLTTRMTITDMRDILANPSTAKAHTIGKADYKLSDVTLELPVTNPTRIYCIGVNYMNRNEEYKDGSNAPAYPSVFVRNPRSFVAHGQALEIPPESEQLDYEGEIVLVIGKEGRRIKQAEAMDHVAGLTVMNEGSIRDWIRHGKFNVTPGKNWDKSGGIGPWIETDLSGIDVNDMRVETHVNGELRQSDTTASMAFPFARIIEYLSTFGTLEPGDLIATGTPTGAGARFDPPIWLREGDEVAVTVEGVGILKNSIRKEP
ncbi:MAG: 2-keto-4-pentenoate hydratase/2-oxohepta-3-ene-1,7-dioic acid hydratase in catechol pathway [Paracoccaceae bacterium]|jgi:2-keto-4-pentenoate hydratase/2-oxohepta-3-ene-1,7-dioic acid hydratase in catechol pathway